MDIIKSVNVEFTLLETTAKRIDEVCRGLDIDKCSFVDRMVSKNMPLDPLDSLQRVIEDIGIRTYMLEYEDRNKVYELLISYLADALKRNNTG